MTNTETTLHYAVDRPDWMIWLVLALLLVALVASASWLVDVRQMERKSR